MQKVFQSLVQSYAEQNNFSCTFAEGDVSAEVNIADFPLYLAYQGEIDSLVLSCAIAPMPKERQGKVYAELLKRNNLFLDSRMCTFGFNTATNQITLQSTWPMRELNEANFGVLVTNFLELLCEMFDDLRYDFLDWQYNETDAQEDNLLFTMNNMIRV